MDRKPKFLESFKPYVERGNAYREAHGKISLDMIILTYSSSKPPLRTDKDGISRKANYAAFEEEIQQCYDKAEFVSVDPFRMPKHKEGDEALRKAIRKLILSSRPDKADSISSAAGDC